MKHGAWTPCPKCRHTPKEPEDVAKHLITTDHYLSRADLDALAVRVQTGQPLHFDPKNVADIVASLKTRKPDDKRLRRFVTLYAAAFIFVLVAAIALGVYFVGRFLSR